VIIICLLMAVLDGFDAQTIGYAAPAIGAELGVTPAAFATVFSVGLLGMALGSVLFGSLADRIGRRTVILLCVAVFALCTLAVVLTNAFALLLVLRFVAGLGLGGATPSLIALSAEYTPQRLRSTVVMVIVGALPLGAFLGGVLAAVLIPAFGWRSVFLVGGSLPFLMLIVAVLWLPESLHRLAARGPEERFKRVARGLAPEGVGTIVWQSQARVVKSGGAAPVGVLFRGRRRMDTALLWITFFSTLLALFLLLNWLPTLLHQSGMVQSAAVVATAGFSLGGFVGSIVLGQVIDRRRRPFGPLLFGYAVAIVFTAATAFSTGSVVLVVAFAVVMGFGLIGCQTGISAVAASLYPADARGTGVGWAFGVGRVGSILGPALAGGLLTVGLAPAAVIAFAAAPTALAALGLAGLARRADNTEKV